MYIPDNCEEAAKVIIKRKDASTMEGWDELDAYDKVKFLFNYLNNNFI